MIHAGLSSAIMAEFVEDASGSLHLRQTQRAFLALLSREYRDCAPDRSSDRSAWLSTPHLTYLCALQDFLRERENQKANNPWPSGHWETQDASDE